MEGNCFINKIIKSDWILDGSHQQDDTDLKNSENADGCFDRRFFDGFCVGACQKWTVADLRKKLFAIDSTQQMVEMRRMRES